MNSIVFSKLSIIVLTALLIVGGYYFAGKLIILLMPFIFGYLISKLIDPLVTFLQHKLKIPRGLSTLVLIFGVIFSIGFGAVILIGRLAQGLLSMSDQFPIWSGLIAAYMENVSTSLQSLTFSLPETISTYMSTGIESIMSRLGELSTLVGSSVLAAVTSVPNLLFFIVIMFVSAFFLTKDKNMIKEWMKPIVAGAWTRNEKVSIIRKDVLGVLWGYIKAQLILMTLTFIESAIGLFIIGIAYPIPIALGIAVIDAIPILGPATIYIPWVITNLVIGEYGIAASLFILYLVVTLARQALEPKIVSTQIGIYPLITLLSMYLGLRLLGVVGIILGPMTVIVILALFKTGILPTPHFIEHKLPKPKK